MQLVKPIIRNFSMGQNVCSLNADTWVHMNESQFKIYSVSLDGSLVATQICTEIVMGSDLPVWVSPLLSGQVFWHSR